MYEDSKDSNYDHRGFTITRTPIPMTGAEGRETTGWAFDVRCPEGNPVPVVVESLDRKKGLRKIHKEIEKYLTSLSVAETALDAAQLN